MQGAQAGGAWAPELQHRPSLLAPTLRGWILASAAPTMDFSLSSTTSTANLPSAPTVELKKPTSLAWRGVGVREPESLVSLS